MSGFFPPLFGAGGAGFILYTQLDNNPGIYTNDAARDVFFGANPADLARLDADEFLIIKILDNGFGDIAYQQRQSGVFVDVTSLVQGETGPSGATGNSYFFESDAARDDFFNTIGNEVLLMTGLPIVVNEGSAVTTFVWAGIDSPTSYDSELFIEHPLNTGPGTLFLGLDGANLSSAGENINFTTAYGDTAIAIGTLFDLNGSIRSFGFDFSKAFSFMITDVFDTQLSDPQDFGFLSVGTTYTESLNVRPATAGNLRIRGFAGTDNTSPILEDTVIVITAGDIGNIVNVPITGILVNPGTDLFLEFSGVDLFGGLQTSGDFIGQTKPFLESVINVLTPMRFLDKNDLDQYALMNPDYTTAVGKTGGMVVNTLPTATVDTFTAVDFTPGVAATSNPTLQTVGTATFAADDLILILRGTEFVDSDVNDGLYEVLTHVGTVLTIKGIGLTATAEDFVKDQFTLLTSTGTITKIQVSVLRADSAGDWEVGKGSTTPLSFIKLITTGTGVTTADTLDSLTLLVGAGGTTIQAADDGATTANISTNAAFDEILITAAVDGDASYKLLDSTGTIKAELFYEDDNDINIWFSAVELTLSGNDAITVGAQTTLDLITNTDAMTFVAGSSTITFNNQMEVSSDGTLLTIESIASGEALIEFETPASGQALLVGYNDGLTRNFITSSFDLDIDAASASINLAAFDDITLLSTTGDVTVEATTGSISFTSTDFIYDGSQLKIVNGTELLPAYSFISDPDTGMRRSAANTLNFSAGGVDVLQLNTLASAINFLVVTPSVLESTDGVLLTVDGDDANIILSIESKGGESLLLGTAASHGDVDMGRNHVIRASVNGVVGLGSIQGSSSLVDGRAVMVQSDGAQTKTRISIREPNLANELSIGIGDATEDSGAAFFNSLDATELRFGTSSGTAISVSGLSVGMGIISPDSSARLDVVSTTQGFLAPRMTTVQRDVIATPATGLQIYNTDTNKLNFFNGTSWIDVGTTATGWTDDGTVVRLTTSTDLVGIGRDDPISELDVFGSINVNNAVMTPFGGLGRYQNMILFSEQFDNAVWTAPFGATVTANNFVAPNGETTGDTLDWTTGTSNLGFRQSGITNLQASTVYTISFWARFVSGNSQQINIDLRDGSAGVFVLDTFVRRYSMTLTSGVGGNFLDINNFGSNTGVFDFWGFQLVEGTEMLPYTKTEAIPLTTQTFGETVAGDLLVTGKGTLRDSQDTAIIIDRTDGTSPVSLVSRVGNSQIQYGDATTFTLATNSAANIRAGIFSGFTPFFAIDSDGNVSIGHGSPDSQLDVIAATDDTESIFSLETTGTNGALVETFVGDQDPNGIITGSGGDRYLRGSGELSALYESREATIGTNWFKNSVNPANIIEITSTAQFESLATAGVITISEPTGFVFKVGVVTATRFDVQPNSNLALTTINGSGFFVYTGTGTLITSVDSTVTIVSGTWAAVAGGTLFDCEGSNASAVFIQSSATFFGWNLGSISRISTADEGMALLFHDALFLEHVSGLEVIDCGLSIQSLIISKAEGTTTGEAFIKFSSPNNLSATISINTGAGTMGSTDSLIRIDAGLQGAPAVLISNNAYNLVTGTKYFDTSGIAPTAFTTVADNSLAATAITSVAAGTSGTVARFTTGGSVPLLGQVAAISGFVTNTDYNRTGVVTFVSGSTFEIDHIEFGTTETGSVIAPGVTITSTAHGLSTSTGVTLDTTDAADYDGHFVIYNVQTNTFDVSTAFTVTQAGTWSTQGLDQKDVNVLAFGNPGLEDSHYIATAFVNNNATVNGAIVNNTFTDMVFGTAGVALNAGSTIERFKLIDELNGTFEFTGVEDFSGLITFDFTVVSSGGTVNFRFKWQKSTDGGSTFVDLIDNVESLVAVGTDAQSVTKTFPLAVNTGDQIKPQITRNSGTSGITTSYATIYATQ